MHSVLIAGAFLAMVLAPCVVASCSRFFPLRVRIKVRSRRARRRQQEAMQSIDPLMRVIRRSPDAQTVMPQTPHSR